MNSPHLSLILSPHMTPHRVAPWQHVITELFTGKVEIIAEYDEIIYFSKDTGSIMRMPAVARLIKPFATTKKGVKFSRPNVYARDGFRCQYCGEKKKMSELNQDHVVPRKQGGRTVWDNIVASCYPCNDKKGARTPAQAGMKLLRKPSKPKTLPLERPDLSMRDIPEQWLPWVQQEA